ncbi:hypothetical protein [Streptomyces sp. NPDC047108]|uniref:hypothetical protein n=1 Tax=Streptomyces sp. NPDC047108 TaxID=3155025 RepID=UPI0033CF581F
MNPPRLSRTGPGREAPLSRRTASVLAAGVATVSLAVLAAPGTAAGAGDADGTGSATRAERVTAAADGATPCVDDVRGSVTEKLRDHGDTMGVHLGGGMPDPEQSDTHRNDHLQGVQRLPADGGRWLAMSYDDTDDGPGGVGFAHLPSRSPAEDGGRLRSNRLGAASSVDQSPPASDQVVSKIDSGRNDLDHAGGMQALGSYLAVPYEGSAASSEVRIYDVGDPASPVLKSTLVRTGIKNSGNVGWTRLADGRHLLMVGGYDSTPLDFYASDTIDGPYTHLGTWRGDFAAYQSTNIVTECGTGNLFIVGSYKTGGEDTLDVYSLALTPNPDIAPVGSRHMYCATDGVRQCDFSAAGGVYVSPAHELYFYATEHENDGPSDSVKFSEFRTATPNASTCATNAASSWVELYEHDHFGGRSIIIDHPDQELENYADYDTVEDFGDEASSARWCLTPDQTYQLFKDSGFKGNAKWLTGVGEDADFGELPGIAGWTDTTSSSRF